MIICDNIILQYADSIDENSLQVAIMQEFEKYLNDFPIIPAVASKIMAVAEDNLDISFKDLEEMVGVDPMLTAKILKIANSALYARQNEIVNLQMAIGLLGFKTIKSLVILITASKFSQELKNREALNGFWKHSLATAFIARQILKRKKDSKNEESVFIAGLLHDIGQVALFQRYPDRYRDFPANGEEVSLFGTDHRRLGGYILRKWNFPDMYADVAEEHGSRNIQSIYKTIVYTVSLADFLTEKIGFGQGLEVDDDLFLQLIDFLHMDAEDILYFQHDFLPLMEQDHLFAECQDIFLV